jgi:hypothetical protein
MGLFVPVISSGYLGFQVAPSAGAAFFNVHAGVAAVSALTPGNTGGVALGADTFTQLRGFSGPLRITAAVAQDADRTFTWHFKG